MIRIKRILLNFRFFRDVASFRQRYVEPNAVSIIKFILFNWLPIPMLHFLFKREEYIPVDRYSSIIRGNVFVGKCSRIQRSGCYVQGRGKVFIGDYVEVASNVVIISANHDLYDQDSAVYKETIIGDHCWIASNVSVLAGVVLGPRTIVGAGSVVTKSFPQGYCVLAGNPAKVIKELEPSKVHFPKDEVEFYGYLNKRRFKKYFDHYYCDLKYSYPVNEVSNNEFYSDCGSR